MKNLNSSSWTGRAPRSLEGAFGPSVRSTHALIVPMESPEPVRAYDWALYAVGIVALVVVWWLA